MTQTINRQIVLASRPHGAPTDSNFRFIARYLRQLATHPAYQKANQIEAQHA